METMTKSQSKVELVDQIPRSLEGISFAADLAKVQRLSRLLDNRYRVMGVGFGWDGIMGLIPGIGDILTAGMSTYIIYLARKHGAPKWLISRMIWNAGVDVAVGIVPVVGDVADFAWKSNLKNVRLLEKHLKQLS